VGEHLFTVLLLTLFMFFWLDVFWNWYEKFLARFGFTLPLIKLFKRIFWLLMTIIFWFTLLHRGFPKEFTITHFAFALFILCLYNAIKSFFKK